MGAAVRRQRERQTAPAPGVALVTGGAAGIGLAIARRLGLAGYRVGILDLDGAAADRAAAALRAEGIRAGAFPCDVGNRAAVFRAVEAARDALGEVGVLVNNAGILRLGPLVSVSEEDWRALFRVNVDGVLYGCQAVLPRMMACRRGNIVNVASWNGKLGAPYFGAYSATKAAVISLTQTLAREVASFGIRVNAVCPGIVAGTAMRAQVERGGTAYGLPPSVERARAIPLRRLGRPEEVAHVVAFLVSEDAAYMTGQAVNVTGGLWLH